MGRAAQAGYRSQSPRAFGGFGGGVANALGPHGFGPLGTSGGLAGGYPGVGHAGATFSPLGGGFAGGYPGVGHAGGFSGTNRANVLGGSGWAVPPRGLSFGQGWGGMGGTF